MRSVKLTIREPRGDESNETKYHHRGHRSGQKNLPPRRDGHHGQGCVAQAAHAPCPRTLSGAAAPGDYRHGGLWWSPLLGTPIVPTRAYRQTHGAPVCEALRCDVQVAFAQFIAVCSSVKPCVIGENLLSV